MFYLGGNSIVRYGMNHGNKTKRKWSEKEKKTNNFNQNLNEFYTLYTCFFYLITFEIVLFFFSFLLIWYLIIFFSVVFFVLLNSNFPFVIIFFHFFFLMLFTFFCFCFFLFSPFCLLISFHLCWLPSKMNKKKKGNFLESKII